MAEKEYIERMVAITEACKGCNEEFSNNPCEPPDCSLQRRLFAIPAADVVEVKHGEWIEKEIPLNWCEDDVEISYECSICDSPVFDEYPYCPNCGAKMDGERRCEDG